MPIITIIIPVYNVAAYLPKCIESIQNQIFQEIEILLINDGSIDESPQICDRYALNDSRIRVIHQKNQGVSCARNVGISAAQGDFITFVDSDDWIGPDFLRLLYEALQSQTEASISFCEHYIVKDGKKTVNDSFSETRLYSADEAIYQLCLDNKIKCYIWGKLYRRELFQDIRFPEDRTMCEDMAILYLLFYASDKIVHIPDPGYYYLIRPDSCMNNDNNIDKTYQYFLAFYEMCMFIRKKNLFPNLKAYKGIERKLLRRGIHLLHRLIQEKNDQTYNQMVKDLFSKLHALDNLSFKDIGMEYYIKRKLIYTNFPFYSHIYKLFKRKR